MLVVANIRSQQDRYLLLCDLTFAFLLASMCPRDSPCSTTQHGCVTRESCPAQVRKMTEATRQLPGRGLGANSCQSLPV